MKKISILFISALSFGLTMISCNKDDDNDSTPAAAAIEGKWSYSKQGIIQGSQESFVDYSDNVTGCSKDYIQINANGTFSDVDYDSTNAPCEAFTDAGTWTKTGDVLKLIYTNTDIGTDTYTIVSLTASSLKIKIVGSQFDGSAFILTR